MDGASKFVRGDAIAAIIITLINLLGGFAVGILQQHLTPSQAVHTYSLLSVGDGLVSQIPALLLSISTGIMVTRATTEDDFGTDVLTQLRRQHNAVRVAAVVMLALAIIPGLPHIAFLIVGGLLFFASSRFRRAALAPTPVDELIESAPEVDSPAALAGEVRVDPLELELALDLIDLVGDGGDLLDRVKGLRRKVAGDLGLIVPPVRTRDNLDLAQGTYSIRLHGVEAGRGMAPPGRLLCIGDGIEALPGESTVEPVFGLAAKWVPTELRQQALMAGVTVVDRSSVITTHLGEVIADNAGRLLSTQQLRTLLDLVKEREPVVMEEMAAANLGLSELQRVLCELLNEGVPIRDLGRITEAVSERARVTKDPDALLEAARGALGPAITALYAEDGTLFVITIDAVDERMLLDAVTPGDLGLVLMIDPGLAERLAQQTATLAEQAEQAGHQPVLLCSSRLRPALQRMLHGPVPRLHVMGVNEVATNVKLERLGTVHLAHEIVAA